MATYDNDLRLKEITTGDEDGTWGDSTNTNLELIADGFSYGTKEMAADANETFTMPDFSADATRSLYLKITSAVSLTATREVTLGPNTVSKTWIIENATSGSQIITIKQGSGATVNVPNGSKVMVVTDGAGAGAAVFNANPTEVGGTVTSIDVSGGTTGLTTSGGPVTTSGTITLAGTLAVANGGTGVTSSTGTGSVVLSNSPTFTGTVTIPTADINGGTIDGTVIGGSTAAAGTFTTGQFNTSLNVDGTATLDGLTVDGAAVFNEGGGDNDFRVESDTNTHALFLEGSSGNVGIGTSSPSSSLTVQSDSGALFADSGNTRFVEIIPPQSSNSFVGEIGTRSSHSLVLNTVNVERMRIDTSGNVGIGTSSPSSVLHVSDTTQPQITMQDSTNSSFGRITGGGTTGSLTLEADYTNTKAGTVMTFNVDNTERLRIDSSGNIRLTGAAPNAEDNISTINFYNSSSSVNLASIIGKRTAGGTNYGSLTFNTTSSGSIAERMRITSSGNVGIGTSSPTAILTLVVANNFPFLHWNNASGSNIAFAGWHGGTGGGGDFRIGATGTTPLTFQTNTTERMRINSSGNVGIGTSSPLAKLQITQSSSGSIVNALVLQNPNALVAGTGTKLYFSCVSDNLRGSYIESAATTNLNDTYLAFATNPAGFNATERMRITSSGNVGIGELNPEGLLHLTGDTNANGAELYLQVNNNNTTDNLGAINFGNNVDSTLSKILSGTSGASNSSYLTFSTSSSGSQSEAMRITSSGDVGIGTSLPVAKFHVTPTYNAGYTGSFSGVSSYNPTSSEILVGTFLGSAASAGDYTGIRFQINGNTSGIASASIIASREAAEGNGSTALSFLTRAGTGDTTERMRITSTGNVVIGATAPIRLTGGKYLTLDNASETGIELGIGGVAHGELFASGGDVYLANRSANSIIFRTNTSGAERMRIDSSGNLLVGTTSTATSTVAGVVISATNSIFATRDDEAALWLNRLSTDGDIIKFRKDGSGVGSIFSHSSGNMGIGTGDTGVLFAATSETLQPWNTSTNSVRDAAIDLGVNGGRFKDLYLSGGVYLGGIGAANKLDDYEEGTFTPSLSATVTSPTVTYSGQQGFYTKIGNVVRFSINIGISTYSGGSGNIQVQGLPFTSAASQYPRHFAFTTGVSFPSGRTIPMVYNQPSSTIMYMQGLGDNVAESFFSVTNFAAGDSLVIVGTYQV
jgi:hypothetical protein